MRIVYWIVCIHAGNSIRCCTLHKRWCADEIMLHRCCFVIIEFSVARINSNEYDRFAQVKNINYCVGYMHTTHTHTYTVACILESIRSKSPGYTNNTKSNAFLPPPHILYEWYTSLAWLCRFNWISLMQVESVKVYETVHSFNRKQIDQSNMRLLLLLSCASLAKHIKLQNSYESQMIVCIPPYLMNKCLDIYLCFCRFLFLDQKSLPSKQYFSILPSVPWIYIYCVCVFGYTRSAHSLFA